jgi:tRNA A37 threonylcarbamoyladenosine synthetase subunit TsaC/SUA5/YrdC
MPYIVPTNTCYGIAGEQTLEEYTAIYRLKGREFSKPLAWIVRDYDDLHEYIEITDEQIDFLKNYPRPWTILAPKKSSYILPDFLDPIQYSRIAFRVATACIPDRSLQEKLSYPLFLTSANLS